MHTLRIINFVMPLVNLGVLIFGLAMFFRNIRETRILSRTRVRVFAYEPMTDEQLEERLCRHMVKAKLDLARIGPEKGGDSCSLPPLATVVFPDGTEKELGMGWKNDTEKYRQGEAVSKICFLIGAAAVIFRTAISGLRSDTIAEVLHLDPHVDVHDPQKLRYLQERMWAWVRQTTGGEGRIGLLPDKYRIDGLVVSIMGPGIKETGRMVRYHWRDGTVFFEEAPENEGVFSQRVIPKWWQ